MELYAWYSLMDLPYSMYPYFKPQFRYPLVADLLYSLPANPPTIQSPLLQNCAIALGAPGTTRNVTIPYISSGRIYFCVDGQLTFLLNPSDQGAALVEPSISNTSDPNYNLNWGFCEFTYNSSQLFANITFVDFVSLPISLTLTNTSGGIQSVGGIPSDGLTTIANGMIAQNSTDGAGWDQLVVNKTQAVYYASSRL